MTEFESPATARYISGAGLADKLTHLPMVAILWLGVAFHLVVLARQLPARIDQFDFSIYYASGLALREGVNPYTTKLDGIAPKLNLEIDPIHYATDPPTFLMLFEPVTRLPLKDAFWLWTALNVGAFVASLWLLLAGAGVPVRVSLTLAALACVYAPVGEHLFYGQNKLFILLIIALMMRWMAHGRDAAAGMILGFASVLRGFPIILIGYCILRRRWRVVFYAAVGAAATGLVTVAVLGWSQTLSFADGLRFVTKARFLAMPINVSLGAFVSRIYWYVIGPGAGISNDLRVLLVDTVEVGLLWLTANATLRSCNTEDVDYRVFSLWVVTSVMLSPTAWVHYLVLMIVPLVAMSLAAESGRANHRALWMAVASYLLISVSTIGRSAMGPHPHGPVAIAIAECSFLSLAMMYVSVYWFATDELAAAGTSVTDDPARVVGGVGAGG